ncbi:MAG TPA: transcriptional regulator NrdR [Actinomycetota bacterium]|nr:transcriptional regulator NrdR [Actinomycetota bacterium]
MRCPFCSHPEDHVVDSRMAEEGRAIRRRRQCESCGQRYTTYERIEEIPLLVQKRDGTREPFNKEKLISGVRKACKNRPVSAEDLDKLAEDVVDSVKEEGSSVVMSADLGMQILERLRVLDDVAYLRFASVYKDFQELNDFEKELGLLQKKIPPKERSAPPTH